MAVPQFQLEATMEADGVAYYNMADAAIFAGMTIHGLNKRVDRWNEEHKDAWEKDHKKDDEPIEKVPFGGRSKYYKRDDLRRLFNLSVSANK
ncbi:hypothetical protein ccbrp13_56180 [Ktedonobacteria bacterium brp13]|nr:hypothetical protein ccbrp13_56180 [Ktedonobacteria bacterium brp13]